MSANTKIGWTDATWPVIRGCSKVSPGCKNCWAIRDAHLHAGNKNPKMQAHFGGLTVLENGRPNWTGVVRLDEGILEWPLRWKTPAMVFAASSGDLWHERLLRGEIARVYAVMAYCQWHTFQVLTKRPQDRQAWFQTGIKDDIGDALQRLLHQHGPPPHAKPFKWPLPNVWEGVSIEDQANKCRMDTLRQTPAAVRFVSLEPLLEDLGELDLSGIDWGIVGGESGPGARPCDLNWIDSTVEQFRAFKKPLFVKQLGSKPFRSKPDSFSTRYPITDSKGANWDEWPRKLRIRRFPR